MGIFDSWTGVTQDVVPKEVVVQLTPLGQEKANRISETGAEMKVLAVLNERGPCSLNELSNATGFELDKLRLVLRQMKSHGYIRRVN